MKVKNFISWSLIFTFFLWMMQPLITAKEIEHEKIQAKIAAINLRLENIQKEFQKHNEKAAEQAKKLAQVPKAKAADPEVPADYFHVGIDAPSEAYVGDAIPIVIAAENATTVTKINLTITDPANNNKEHFKGSYMNDKLKEDKFFFSYQWDTFEAKTNADSANTTHKVIVDVFEADQNTPAATATYDIKVKPDPGIDILAHGFWGPYLKNTGNFSAEYANKLGCGSGECTTKEDVQSHLTDAIQSGKFTQGDLDALQENFNRYTHKVETNLPSGEDDIANTAGISLAMADLTTFATSEMAIQTGGEDYQISEATLLSPDALAVAKVVNKYSLQLAYLRPESAEEVQKLEIWPKMEEEIRATMSTDPEDYLASSSDFQGLQGVEAASSSLAIPEAQAVEGVIQAVSIAMTVWDIKQAIQEPTFGNIAIAAADVIIDVVTLGHGTPIFKGIVLAAGKLRPIAGIARLISKVKGLRLIGRITEGLKPAWAVIKKVLPTKVATWIEKYASKAVAFMAGRFKKAADFTTKNAKALAAIFAKGLLNGFFDNECGCVDYSQGFVKGAMSMFLAPLCGVLCTFINAMIELAAKLFDWFPNAIEAYVGPPSLAREQFIR